MKFTSSISRIGTHGIFADGGAFVPTQEKKKAKVWILFANYWITKF